MPLANIAKSVVDVAVVGGGIDLGRSSCALFARASIIRIVAY